MEHILTFYVFRGSYISELQLEDQNEFGTIQKDTEVLRNYNSNKELRMSPDIHSHTNSPNSTISRGMHCRPSPPPYVRPKYKPDF